MARKEFASIVIEIVRSIPDGFVTTYGRVATLAGSPRAARAVGNVLRGTGGEDVPWQRVLNASGRISGGSSHGRALLQRNLLQTEGVRFDERGAVALNSLLWQPEAEQVSAWAARAQRLRDDDWNFSDD